MPDHQSSALVICFSLSEPGRAERLTGKSCGEDIHPRCGQESIAHHIVKEQQRFEVVLQEGRSRFILLADESVLHRRVDKLAPEHFSQGQKIYPHSAAHTSNLDHSRCWDRRALEGLPARPRIFRYYLERLKVGGGLALHGAHRAASRNWARGLRR